MLLPRALAAALALGLTLAACVGDDEPALDEPASSTTTTTAPAAPSTTVTTTGPVAWAPVDPDGPAKAVVTPTGVVVVVQGRDGERFVVRTPCGNEATVTGTPVTGANVVLDAGHGGVEPGAIGPGGTQEKVVNLAIAEKAKARLEALGATVVLTRTGDYRVPLAARAGIATALAPQLFVSVHHNAEPDGPNDGPGAETYYQVADPASKRAAGLLWEELVAAFAAYDIAWVADTDHGTKYRTTGDGGDYYGILRRSAGVPTVLSEAAFISNPPEEALLTDPAFQEAEAEALTKAIVRFVTTQDPGSGFVVPYPRTQPAGSSGGAASCVDPPLS